MDDASRVIVGEAAVDAVLEPPQRRWFSRKVRAREPLTHCENCGARLGGPYCAQCGQHAVDYRRSIWRVLVDAADSFLNWDTKFLSTIGVLVARPWKLTNDFNAGRRARYVHPLRLCLLASIAFFLLAKMVHLNPANAIKFDPNDRPRMDAALAKLSAPAAGLSDEDKAKVEAARAKLAHVTGTSSNEDRKEIQEALSTLIREGMKQKLKANDRARVSAALDRLGQTGAAPETTPPASASPSPSTVPSEPETTQSPGEKKRGHNAAFETWMEGRLKAKIGEGGSKWQLFFETLRNNIPTMMLCCIPLFALILKVLYIRQRRFYVEHLIYALHIHTFAYVSVVVITLLAMAAAHWAPGTRGLIIGILTAAAAVQVFLSIRRVYRQGWFFSTFKFLLGGVAYFVVLVLAVVATAFITLLLPG